MGRDAGHSPFERPPTVSITEGPAGRSVLAWAEVPAALRPWVEALWYSEGPLSLGLERVLPSATGDLVLNLGADMRLVEGVGDPLIRGGTTSGLLLRPIVLGHPPVHRALGFRLRPLGTRALLGVPVGRLNDQCVALADVLGLEGVALTERCGAAVDAAAALAVAARWALDRARRSEAPDPIARWAVEALVAGGGRRPVADVVQRSGYGATRFNQRFVDEVGLTPKRFGRLVRFRAALDALAPGRRLAEVALATGHADQAHLCAEFQAFAGRTPTEVLAARYPAGLTLAEPGEHDGGG